MSEEKIEYHHFSDQAIMSIVMAIQEGIMNQEDVTDMMRNFSLVETDEGLVVNNPPRMHVDEEDLDDGDGEDNVIVDPNDE